MGRLRRSFRVLKEMFWGLLFFDMYHESHKAMVRYRDGVDLLLFADQLGVPVGNSYVTLRLLPYMVGDLEKWKRRQMKERDVLDEVPDIH